MSDRWMSDFEIRQSYKNAIKPSKQIKILAELNDCDPAEIRKVLGIDKKGSRMANPTTKEVNAKEVVRALRWLARETEFVFAAEQLREAADLIESLQADNAELRKANSEYQDAQHPLFMALCDAQRRADAAVWKLQSIDWVGSGAKARIEDAIAILTEGGAQAGEVQG